jgi:PAS domain S-box-containing protein
MPAEPGAGHSPFEGLFDASPAGTPVEVPPAPARERSVRAQLEASERRFHALLARVSEPIWLLDAELRVVFASPAAEVVGLGSFDLVGRRFSELGALVEEDEPEVMVALEEAIARGNAAVVRVAGRFCGRSGEVRTIELEARNLLADDDVRGVVVNGRDVSEQRLVEERLRSAQKLESIGRLAGGIAHEFNNVLTIAASGLDAIRAAAKRGLPAREPELLAMDKAFQRGADLTRRLLAFAHGGPGALAPADLNAIVQGTEQLLRRVLGENVDIVVRAAEGLPRVACDPAQIEQALLNLATDARDEMPEGGTIVIQTSNVGAGRKADGRVQLSMHHVRRGHLDEARVRLLSGPISSATRTEEPHGAVGLAIVEGIVHRMGGSLRCTGERGLASVVLELPSAAASSSSASTSPATPPEATSLTGTETILLVEDDELLRHALARALQRAGYRVIVAESGLEALERARAERTLHLVLCDVVMPGISGPETVAQLRERRPELKAIYVSGYVEDSLVARELQAAGEALVSKPFDPAALLARVRAALDG